MEAAWAEDRATQGCDPSAAPGVKPKAGGATGSCRPLFLKEGLRIDLEGDKSIK
jgi:hypothetical protein